MKLIIFTAIFSILFLQSCKESDSAKLKTEAPPKTQPDSPDDARDSENEAKGYKRVPHSYSSYKSLASGSVNSVFVDKNDSDKMYVGTSAGLSISTNGGNSFRNVDINNGYLSNFIKKVIVDSSKNIYILSQAGISVSNDGAKSFKILLRKRYLFDLHVGTDGVLHFVDASRYVRSTDNGKTFSTNSSFFVSGRKLSVLDGKVYARDTSTLKISNNNGVSFDTTLSNASHGYPTNTNGVYVDSNHKIYVTNQSNNDIFALSALDENFALHMSLPGRQTALSVNSAGLIVGVNYRDIVLQNGASSKLVELESILSNLFRDSNDNFYIPFYKSHAEGLIVFPEEVFNAEKIAHPDTGDMVTAPAIKLHTETSDPNKRAAQIYPNKELGVKRLTAENGIIGSPIALEVLKDGKIILLTSKGICVSKNNGETFKYHYMGDKSGGIGGSYSRGINITVTNSGKIFVGSTHGQWLSEDNGESFDSTYSRVRFSAGYGVGQDSRGNLYAAGAGNFGFINGLYVSKDDGETYSLLYNKRISNFSIASSGRIYITETRINTGFLMAENLDSPLVLINDNTPNSGLPRKTYFSKVFEIEDKNIYAFTTLGDLFISNESGSNFKKLAISDQKETFYKVEAQIYKGKKKVAVLSSVGFYYMNFDGSDPIKVSNIEFGVVSKGKRDYKVQDGGLYIKKN